MFNQYSYKIKFKFLIVLFFMLSIAAYRRSFSSLIEVVKENRILKSKVESFSNKTNNIGQLNSEIKNLDRMIGREGVNKEKTQQELVNFLLENSNNVSIFNMQPIHEYTEDNYKVYSYVIDLTGGINNLMDAAYKFEKEFEYSKIVSTNYYTEKKNNKFESLHLKIIFQKYESY